MKLVIVESPAKAKTINKYLGNDYKVVASFGHIRDLPSKDGSVLPDEDFAMKYEISAKSTKHVKEICDSAKSADTIFLATDPDREGEAISWHIVETLKLKKALKKDTIIKRVAFSEITKKAILEAIKDARAVDQNLVDAQQARRALDYLVGFTLSPVLWRKLPGSKSAGRVQSVALRLICEREQEIERFITREYWSITTQMMPKSNQQFKARLDAIDKEKLDKFAIISEEQAHKLVTELKKHKYFIADIEKKQQKRQPQAPFTTSSLQQEASRKLGFGAKKTMQIAQKLYEGMDVNGETVALITYMRTDGVSLAQDAVNATREWIEKNLGEKYLPNAPRIYKTKAKNAQEAHEAIRPVDPSLSPDKLKNYLESDFYRLYDLIWKRTIACQMENVIVDTVGVNIDSEDKKYTFRANGSTIVFDGFYKIYKEDIDDATADSDEGNMLPLLVEGEEVNPQDIIPNQHFTEPPPRYSEASLVKKLEELGIGRPSTYAPIISVLQEREYVRIDKKRFIPEDRGMIVTVFLVNYFPKYVEYNFTAGLEEELDNVSEGTMEWKDLLRNFWTGFNEKINEALQYKMSDVITQVDAAMADRLFPPKEDGTDPRQCPTCAEGKLSLKLGKFGAFVACDHYPECKFTRQLTQNTSDEENTEVIDKPKDVTLGQNAEGHNIYLKTGPYGPYVQIGEAKDKKDKPKRMSLPAGFKPEEMTLNAALWLLSLPKNLGKHPESGEEILLSIGKFGPYVKHAGKFVSVPKNIDLMSVDIDRAVDIISKSKK